MKPAKPLRIIALKPPMAPAVARMMGKLAAFHGDVPRAKASFFIQTACGARRITNVFVACMGEKPVGFIEFHSLANYKRGNVTVSVDYFFVEEKWRGRGIGFAMIQKVMAKALKDGCSMFVIGADPANPLSNACYRKIGLAGEKSVAFKYRADKDMMQRIAASKSRKSN